MRVSAGICPSGRSSGAVTRLAVVSGLAPGKLRGDLDGRKIDLRQGGYRQPPIAERPCQRDGEAQ